MVENILSAAHPVVPSDDKQPAKDFSEVRSYPSVDEAEDAFVEAKNHLLHPARWHHLAGALSADFQPHNGRGEPTERAVRTGDLLCIHVPGPAGLVNDWVRVEALTYDDFPDEQRESMALRVRPTTAPDAESSGTTHFFSKEATSSFVLERRGQVLTAAYHGRHEVPNSEGSTLLRKVRDMATALSGLFGFSDMQWKSLLRGLLDVKEIGKRG